MNYIWEIVFFLHEINSYNKTLSFKYLKIENRGAKGKVMCRFSLEHGIAFVIDWILEFIILKPFLLTFWLIYRYGAPAEKYQVQQQLVP